MDSQKDPAMIRFTNTLGGEKVAFEPIDTSRVGIYVCGPTVYDVAHVGHARNEVTYDVLPRDLAPRASGHILEMQEMISALIEKGYAYPGEGSVYFSVERFEGYGKLSGRGLDVLAARERVEPAPGKRHPLDFALWKAAK